MLNTRLLIIGGVLPVSVVLGQLQGYPVLVGDSPYNDINSSIRTPEECANWCNEFDNCHGFSVVRQGVNPDINRCSLKHTLTFPPMSSTTIDNVLTYYRLHEPQGNSPSITQHEGYYGFEGDSPHNDLMSSNRTPRECADWCDTFDTCHGFAVVQEGFISGINKCWLKTKLTYPPPYPNREGVLIYYKVNPTCPPLTVDNGRAFIYEGTEPFIRNGRYLIGTVLEVNCSDGHTRNGSTSFLMTCQDSQEWNSQAATCDRDCVPGYFRNSTDNECKPCPIGTYSGSVNADFCTRCPRGFTTAREGNSHCIKECSQGNFGTTMTCIPCPIGSYSDQANVDSCTDCGSGYTTRNTGSNHRNQCIRDCQPGTYRFRSTYECFSCPVGSYSTTTNVRDCTGCPDLWTTAHMGSTSSSQCNVVTGRRCGFVGYPEGEYGFVDYPPPRQFYTDAHGYTVHFGCTRGRYWGRPTSTCNNGTWSSPPGRCL